MNDQPASYINFGEPVRKVHTDGRRESRVTQTKGYYVPRPDGKPGTMPIKRSKPKRDGLSKKEWKRAKRENRETA